MKGSKMKSRPFVHRHSSVVRHTLKSHPRRTKRW